MALERNAEEMQKLSALLAETHETDAPEIDALRDVAYNDVLNEINRADYACKLNMHCIWRL